MFLGPLEVIVLALLFLAVIVGIAVTLRGSTGPNRRRRVVVLMVAAALLIVLLGLGVMAGLAWTARTNSLGAVEVSVHNLPVSPVWTEVADLPSTLTGVLEHGQWDPNLEKLDAGRGPEISLKLSDGRDRIVLEADFDLRVQLQLLDEGDFAYVEVRHSTSHGGKLDWRAAIDLRWQADSNQLAVDVYVGPPDGALQTTTLRFHVSPAGLELVQP